MSCRVIVLALLATFVVPASWAQTSATPLPVLAIRLEPARDPWWQRATINPRATAVRGMPVKRFEPAWCAAEAFTRDFFGADLLGPASGSPLEGLAFALEGSFDGSGKLQSAFVGAYRRCDGERGLFVAITDSLARRAGERSRMRFLVEVPEPGTAFAALALEPDGTLAVWWCGGCDKGHRIAYNRESGGFYVAGPATRR